MNRYIGGRGESYPQNVNEMRKCKNEYEFYEWGLRLKFKEVHEDGTEM
jgi:hypothetical protein